MGGTESSSLPTAGRQRRTTITSNVLIPFVDDYLISYMLLYYFEFRYI